jgi:hypothetical protein
MEVFHELFASDVSGVTAISGAIRAGIIANRFRQDLLLSDAGEAPTAILGYSGRAEQENTVQQEQGIVGHLFTIIWG